MRLRPTNLLLGVVVFSIGHLEAQTSKRERVKAAVVKDSIESLKALTIGDRVPDIEFDEVMNYPAKKARLSDFKAELTILDFWSTSCSACVELFPHLQTLKNEFKDRLNIILVDGKTAAWKDNEDKINKLLERQKGLSGEGVHLPIVLNCEALDTYFPAKTIPHEVWLNSNSEVIAITGGNEVNELNITDLLGGRHPSMHFKNDVFIDLSERPLEELVYSGSIPARGVIAYAGILYKGMIDGLNQSGFRKNAEGAFTGLFVTNRALLDLYRYAYRTVLDSLPDNQIVIEGADKQQLFNHVNFDDPGHYDNVYNYDITVPATTLDKILQFMQLDLERAFHARIRTETKALTCLVTKTGNPSKLIHSSGGTRQWGTVRSTSTYHIQNCALKDVLREANRFFVQPLINETGWDGAVDIDMPVDRYDERGIIAALKKIGLEFSEETRKVPVAIISNE